MFLRTLLERNPQFLKAVVALHQAGKIPADSYVVDIDSVAANTSALMTEARHHDLTVYAMTKQLGRAPAVLDAMAASGVDGFVAVDMAGARRIVSSGHNLGHLGHLVQVPFAQAAEAAAADPDYWTVFSPNKASEASEAAARNGTTQDLLVRVFDDVDEFYPGHEGGVALGDLTRMIDHIAGLKNVRLAGFTTFPALLFDQANKSVRTTPNLNTLSKAVKLAVDYTSIQHLEVNAPGTTSTALLARLAADGATQVEPGHGLTGTTPAHAVTDLPETPAVLYLSEVAHIHHRTPYCFGGGLYIDPVFDPYQVTAVVAHDPGEVGTKPVPVDIPPASAIDYYAKIDRDQLGAHSRTVNEGASVLFGFRIQAFVTRSKVTALTGVQSGRASVAGIWDSHGTPYEWSGAV